MTIADQEPQVQPPPFRCGDQAFGIPRWVIRAPIPNGAVVMYAWLAAFGDEHGRSTVSRPQLAEATGLDEKSIGRRIKHLEDIGAVRVRRAWSTETGHEVNSYQLVWDEPDDGYRGRRSVAVLADRINAETWLDVR